MKNNKFHTILVPGSGAIVIGQAAALEIVDQQNWSGELAFTDVGAIVYYLKAVPWLVPGFSVETHLKYLLKLQEQLEKQGKLVFSARKYLIEAHKK